MRPHEDDFCVNCSSKNTLLGGVCVKCCWHVGGRPASDEEIQAASDRLDCAVAEMQVFLGKDVTRQEDEQP